MVRPMSPAGERRSEPLRVGIDAGPLVGQGGISGYVGPLVRTLLAADRDTAYRLILRRGWGGAAQGDRTLDGFAPVVRVRLPDRLLGFWWTRLGRPLPLDRTTWGDLDLFLSTCLMAPVLPQGRVVSIVYDCTPLCLPHLFPEHETFRRRLQGELQRSDALIAISQRTRQDLVELMGVAPARIRVIFPGTGEAFTPAAAPVVAEVIRRHGIPRPYILYVGAMGAHKNVAGLLRAYECARLEGGLQAALVLTGSHRWGAETLATLEGLRVRSDVLLTGPVPAADLPPLYSGAMAFVFPSLYEGFGLPVLEAMACGAPVIASNRGALPEVVGDAGLLADPEEIPALADLLCRLGGDPDLRARLGAAGRRQAARFSWGQSAAALQDLLGEVAGRGGTDA